MTSLETESKKLPPLRLRHIVLFVILPAIMILALVGPWMYRQSGLSRVPSVPVPFDVTSAATVTVAPEDNAFPLYAAAIGALREGTSREWNDHYQTALDADSWEKVPPDIQEWVVTRQPVMTDYIKASKLSDWLHTQPRDFTINTLLNVSQDVRGLARLAAMESLRRESLGDVTGAWELHCATLRASRHLCQHGCVIERFIAVALHAIACERIVGWSRHPKVDAALLRKALSDVREIHGKTPPSSDVLKVKYFLIESAIQSLQTAGSEKGSEVVPESIQPYSMLWMSGEPEISKRVVRLAYTNWMTQMDRPRRERTPLELGTDLYQLGPGSTLTPPQTIQDAHEKATLACLLLGSAPQLITAVDSETARQSLVELHLTLQLFAREHGNQLPKSLAELVPQYLPELPNDLWGPKAPFQYSHEPGTLKATLWSCGQDGIDSSAGYIGTSKHTLAGPKAVRDDDLVLPALP